MALDIAVTKLRRELTRLWGMIMDEPERAIELLSSSMTIVERVTPASNKTGIDCLTYLGYLGPPEGHILMPRLYSPTTSPKKGDYVTYYLSRRKDFSHIGVLQEERRVTSKWGEGSVFDHPIEEVPLGYGNSAYFFEFIPPQKLTEIVKAYYAFYKTMNNPHKALHATRERYGHPQPLVLKW